MAHTATNIIRLIESTQCSIIVDGTGLTVDNLIKIVAAAKSAQSKVTIRSCDRFDIEELIKVAHLANDCVIFDLS